jgi:hypothetical protein
MILWRSKTGSVGIRHGQYFLFLLAILIHPVITAQQFRVGSKDIYGNRHISSSVVFSAFDIKEGDSINAVQYDKKPAADKIRLATGARHVSINLVCCDINGDLMIYLGMGETDDVNMYNKQPRQHARLPAKMIAAYNDYERQLEPAIKKGEASEDDSNGYALIKYLPARQEQNKFIVFAKQYQALLCAVIRNSVYQRDRAAATQVIAYSADKRKAIDCLIYAVNDNNDEVRNNAARALEILAGYLHKHPEVKISIPAAPFIKMMNSPEWTDRNKAASVLLQLTESRDRALLNELKQKCLPSIIEMAKWKDRAHAFFTFVILGRIAGIDDQQLNTSNNSPDYLSLVDSMEEKCCK